MPVGETISIIYLFPIMVILLAIQLLGGQVCPFGLLLSLRVF
jgi:hypothetical protein